MRPLELRLPRYVTSNRWTRQCAPWPARAISSSRDETFRMCLLRAEQQRRASPGSRAMSVDRPAIPEFPWVRESSCPPAQGRRPVLERKQVPERKRVRERKPVLGRSPSALRRPVRESQAPQQVVQQVVQLAVQPAERAGQLAEPVGASAARSAWWTQMAHWASRQREAHWAWLPQAASPTGALQLPGVRLEAGEE